LESWFPNLAAWAGQFADVYITDSELEGGDPGVALRAYTLKLREAALDFSTILGSAWDEVKREQVLRLADHLGRASQLTAGRSISQETDDAGIAPALGDEIAKLRAAIEETCVGNILVVPCE
jgi:hypothetical protein